MPDPHCSTLAGNHASESRYDGGKDTGVWIGKRQLTTEDQLATLVIQSVRLQRRIAKFVAAADDFESYLDGFF
jgi:hypothetical protein